MHISKDQRLDAISGRDQMAEKATNGRSEQTLPDTGMLQHIGIFGKAEGEKGIRLIQGRR